jgi:fluoroacetyl-CoA thioesterase
MIASFREWRIASGEVRREPTAEAANRPVDARSIYDVHAASEFRPASRGQYHRGDGAARGVLAVLGAFDGRSGEPMLPIPIGAKGSFSLTVAPEHLASRFKDATLPAVLATPVMIMLMENAALNAIKPYLEAGETAVGTRVEVRHLAPTPEGRRVTGEAEVTRVDGRRVEFAVSAADAGEPIGAGTHERTVIAGAQLAARLKAKFG